MDFPFIIFYTKTKKIYQPGKTTTKIKDKNSFTPSTKGYTKLSTALTKTYCINRKPIIYTIPEFYTTMSILNTVCVYTSVTVDVIVMSTVHHTVLFNEFYEICTERRRKKNTVYVKQKTKK